VPYSKQNTQKWDGVVVHSMTLGILGIVYAGPNAPKRMSRDAGVSYRTAEKWWARLTTPRADVLLRMAAKNEALRAEMLRALQGAKYEGAVPAVERGVRAKAGAVVAPASGADLGAAVKRGRK
jgi:hypothetical protein